MKQDLIKILKNPEIFRKKQIGILRNGDFSDFYINVKKAYGVPGFLTKCSKEMYNIINSEATCVAGMGIGGIPFVSVYGELYTRPISLIRDKKKNHGTKTQIEAYVPDKKDKIVILDDVYTTGSSLEETAKILEITGAEIIQGCVILTRNEPNIHFPVDSILKLEDIM